MKHQPWLVGATWLHVGWNIGILLKFGSSNHAENSAPTNDINTFSSELVVAKVVDLKPEVPTSQFKGEISLGAHRKPGTSSCSHNNNDNQKYNTNDNSDNHPHHHHHFNHHHISYIICHHPINQHYPYHHFPFFCFIGALRLVPSASASRSAAARGAADTDLDPEEVDEASGFHPPGKGKFSKSFFIPFF